MFYGMEDIMNEIFDKVADIIANQLNIDKSKITPESEVIKDLGADSLDIVEMLMGLEDEYGMTIPDEVAVGLKTVGDIVDLISEKK